MPKSEISIMSTELTKEQKLLELSRIYLSFADFLRYVRIQEPGNTAAKFDLWPHLVEFIEELKDNQLIDVIKAKQIGISWILAAYSLWKIYTKQGWKVLLLSRGQTESQELLDKVKTIYNNLPKWMRVYTLEFNSTEKFGFKEMKSTVLAFSSTEEAGVGSTAGLVIHDEAEFHDYFEVNLSHTRATVADSPDRQLINVSTPSDVPDSYFKRHWKDAYDGKNGFKALFYGVFSRPNRDQVFYDMMARENESTPWVMKRNYPRTIEEALSPQTTCSCFKKEAMDALWEQAAEVKPKQGFIYIFSPPRVGVKYAAGVDVGEGVGRDYSVLTIIGKDGLNSEVVAVVYVNSLSTDLFAYECDKLCREYFNCLLGVENNAIGVAVINKLLELGYPNLYYGDDKKKKAGWTSGERNKYTATVELINVVDNESLKTRFKPQVKEMMEYQWQLGKEPKPVPTGLTHGDTVISLMLAHQMMKKARGVFIKTTPFRLLDKIF